MDKKKERYLYIISPVLIFASLIYYYLTHRFKVISIVTLVIGIGAAVVFFIRFYDEITKRVSKRKLKYGISSILITFIVLCLIVIVYLVTMDHNKRFDLTKSQRFSISDQTQKVVEGLKGPVNAYAFYSKTQDTTSISELFNEYHYYYKDFVFEIVDPDTNPGMVKEMDVEEYGQIMIRYGGKTEKVKSNNEEGITNALIKLSQTSIKNIYFITGHGEKSVEDYSKNGYDKIKAAIKAENYDVKEVLLLREEKIPEDCSVLVSAGPTNDYEPHEIGLIDNYIKDGGRIVFMMDPSSKGEGFKNISTWLEKYGLSPGNNVIIDPLSRVLSGDYFTPVINNYTYNPITKDFKLATFLKLARSIEVKKSPDNNIFTREVARTGESSWAETDVISLFSGKGAKFSKDEDIKGPLTIMAYSSITLNPKSNEGESEKGKEGFILAVGDSDFISNSMYQTQGNKDLFLNSINFLADRGELISIRPKQQESVYLTLTAKQGRFAFFVSLIIIPILVIVVGLYLNIHRRARS